MSSYLIVDGWLHTPHLSGYDGELQQAFKQHWGHPLGGITGETVNMKDPNSVVRAYAGGWRLAGSNRDYLSFHEDVNTSAFHAFRERVQGLVSAFNELYLNNDEYQFPGYPLSGMGYCGHFFAHNFEEYIGFSDQIWVVYDGSLIVYEAGSKFTTEWVKSMKPPNDTASP